MSLSVPGRTEVIRRHREAGGGVAAVFPVHAPRALLRAHGLLPVEVWGPPGVPSTSGDARLQAYVCSIVRCGLAFLSDGGLDVAEVVVVPHACDALQGLGSMLLDFPATPRNVLPFYPPRGQGPGALTYCEDELRAFSARLAELTGRPLDPAALVEAVAADQAADEALAGLWRDRAALPLDNAALYRLVRSREYLPAEDFVALVAQVPRGAAPSGPRLVLSGIVPEPRALLGVLDEAGAVVSADDCAACGRRLYPGVDAASPWTTMARRFLDGPPDSTRGSSVAARAEHLLGLARGSGAQGVLFLPVRSCEPELFYLPQLQRRVEAAGLRTLSLEVDLAVPLPDQAVTRIEAFVETLSEPMT